LTVADAKGKIKYRGDMKYNKLAIEHQNQKLHIGYFIRPGHGEKILYLPGLGCSKVDFAEAANILWLQNHTLVAFDFPGSGNSPYPANIKYGIDDLVEITNIVVCRLKLNHLIIIGHSMGGLVALLYAEKYPEHVKGFINIEGNLASEDCFFSRRIAGYSPGGFTRELLDGFQEKLARSKSRGIREYAGTLKSASEKACYDYAAPLVDYSDNGGLIERFIRLDMPKIFVHGSENHGLSYIPELKERGCKVVEIPDSGHFPFYDNAQGYYRAISDFLLELNHEKNI
jgi:pimeloyl-ACP methyl ester carboxylesterase